MKILAPLVLITLFAACTPLAQSPTAGRALFAQNCTGCHGTDARGGDTIPDLTGLALRAGGTFPRTFVLEKLDGYARGQTAYAGTQMPDFGFLLTGQLARVDQGQGVSRPYPESVIALAAWLESVQR